MNSKEKTTLCPERLPSSQMARGSNANVQCAQRYVGAECQAACVPGMAIFGDSSFTCHTDGTWQLTNQTSCQYKCISGVAHGGKIYKPNFEKNTFLGAEKECQQWWPTAHLALPETYAENIFISTTWPKRRKWLGLQRSERNGAFVTMTGDPLVFSAWAQNEPSSGARPVAQGTHLAQETTWRVVDEDLKLPFVCEQPMSEITC